VLGYLKAEQADKGGEDGVSFNAREYNKAEKRLIAVLL